MRKDTRKSKRAVDVGSTRLVRQEGLRDRFAMAALQGLCASQTIMEYIADDGVRRNRPGSALTTLPQRAYRLADAMMAERLLLPNDKLSHGPANNPKL
jgi:hypothetical protein